MKYSDNRNAYIYFRRALSLGLYVRAKKKRSLWAPLINSV